MVEKLTDDQWSMGQIHKLLLRINRLETVLRAYLDHSKSGLLCCGCGSGEGPESCSECGIKELETKAKKLLGKPV